MGDGPPCFRRGSSCPAVLRIHTTLPARFDYRALTSSGRPSQTVRLRPFRAPGVSFNPKKLPLLGLGSFLFARRYSGNRVCFLFLRVLRCFSSPGLPSLPYLFRQGSRLFADGGFPHSDISGSSLTYSSPKHFGVRPVLLRLPVPRHPPCALLRFTASPSSILLS